MLIVNSCVVEVIVVVLMRGKKAFLNDVIFHGATIHMSVNKHNVRIWGSQHPHEIFEKERDSHKVNVWCGLSKAQVIRPFFFHERNINGTVCLLIGPICLRTIFFLKLTNMTVIFNKIEPYLITRNVFATSWMKSYNTAGLVGAAL